MKKLAFAIVFATALLCSCSTEQKEHAAKSAIEQVSKGSHLRDAENLLVDMKQRMSKEVKQEYFESDEWKAFVDGYWKGYNDGQQHMKNPELKDLSTVVY